MIRLALALALVVALAATASAQGPRVEPPGGLTGPSIGPPVGPLVPPSVPTEPSTPDLIVDLSRPRVSITSAFHGESMLLFGMFDPPGEVVVVVAGPSGRETIMRKQRVLGLWLNTGRQSFDDVPAYYAIAASQPLQRLLARGSGEILSLEDRLATIKPVGERSPDELTQFRNGLVEVKRSEGLYPAAIGQVTVQAGRLFRVELPFPSGLDEGVYDIRTYLLREGKIVAAVSRPLPVGKVGFSAQLAGWAVSDGALYGLGAILMALLVGWAGGSVMRRL
ncbi:MAG: TIGR02186 family protein [Reyranella sp.]|uniref:TIGR02186 family protein n=1 Tax=Reyranella sp. TaxID=1929291 RepID=UPI003D0A4AA5